MRVVSLLPSTTEIVCALGMGKSLVARSHECDYPDWVGSLPFFTEPKFEADGTSYEITKRLEAILQEGLGVYRVDLAQLRALKPDLIITQDHCQVCAVSLAMLEEAGRDLLGSDVQILSVSPSSLQGILDSHLMIAEALGVPEAGLRLIAELEERLARVSDRAVRARDNSDAPPPVVGFVEWLDPPMAGGNWIPELIEMAAGVPAFGKAGEHSPWMDWENLYAVDPDIVVLSPCGFSIAQTLAETDGVISRPGWTQLKGSTSGRTVIADGHEFFNRPGPRVVESLEILCEVFWPGKCDYGHKGQAWVDLPQ